MRRQEEEEEEEEEEERERGWQRPRVCGGSRKARGVCPPAWRRLSQCHQEWRSNSSQRMATTLRTRKMKKREEEKESDRIRIRILLFDS
jgi:hypothetical protein